MNRRTRNIVLSIAGVLTMIAIGVGFAVLTSGDSGSAGTVASATTMPSASTNTSSSSAPVQPTTSETTDSPAPTQTTDGSLPVPGTNNILPKAATGSLQSAMEDKLFDGRVVVLQPQVWFERDGDGDSQAFADTTTCPNDELSDCPRVEFIRLSGPNKVNYGSNPIVTWAKLVCPDRSTDAVQGPVKFDANGAEAGFYLLTCQGSSNYAWYVPGHQLLVTGRDGKGTALEASIVQAVMERIQWKS